MAHVTTHQALASDIASSVLSRMGPANAAADEAADHSLAFATPAASLLTPTSSSGSQADAFAALNAGFKRLAALGEPWSMLGVTLGAVQLAANASQSESAAELPRLTDGAGQSRAVYYPLALHLHLTAFEHHYEEMPVGPWGVCEDAIPHAVAPMRLVEQWSDHAPPTDQPDLIPLTLWQALCLCEQADLLRRDVDLELIDGVVHQIVTRPGQGGSLHPYDAQTDSPDAWVYRELTGLHALERLAARRGNESWSSRVQAIAMYHQDHTQPDHVTGQPWALAAFALAPATQAFADQQLHDAQAYLSGAGDSKGLVAALLLADAAHALAGAA